VPAAVTQASTGCPAKGTARPGLPGPGPGRQDRPQFQRAATAGELLAGGAKGQPRHFQGFIPHLRKRVLEDGCGNATLLYRELREQGYRGSVRTIRRYVTPLRAGLAAPGLPPRPPSAHEVRRWITGDPGHLTDDDRDHLAAILDRSQPLAALDQHVTAFARMLIHRTGTSDLDPWLAAVDAGTTSLPQRLPHRSRVRARACPAALGGR
jgi:hypothetical protein